MDIVKKIDDLRVKKGWSFYKLSQESGLSQQTFSKWMEGNTIPSITALEQVCNALEITLADFFSNGEMIEATPDTKYIFDNWNYLTNEEKLSIKNIIENYVNRKN